MLHVNRQPAFPHDLRAAFDRLNGEKLEEKMRKMGSESREPQHKRILDCEGSQTRVPVEPDVIQYLRGRTGRRTRERIGWGHSGRRNKGSRIITEHGKRRNKRRQRKWKWGEQELEEVDKIRHLGYILQR